MILISYNVDDREAQAFFDYAGYKTRDMREPLERVLRFVRAFEMEVFASEGEALLGHQWDELSDNPPGRGYLSRKERERPGQTILRYDDDLWLQAISAGRTTVDSLTYEVTAQNKRGFDYGEAHMTGTDKMPARPWFGWTQSHEEFTQYVFELWLDELRTANARRGEINSGARPQAPSIDFIYQGLL